jgi:type III secretion protein C
VFPALLGFSAVFAQPVAAAQPDWFEEAYAYVVLDQDVRTTLTEFGRNLGIPVVLSDAVKGRVRGRIEATNAGEFLERLSGANGLTWYSDGAVLHVSADTEFATRVLDAGRLNAEQVTRKMQELGLADDRFSLRGARSGRVITVSGPPAFIAAADQLVQRMQPEPVVAGDDPRVRIFRGGIETEVVLASPTRSTPSDAGGESAVREKRAAKP